jgi:membrane-associated HD superfamily phosphohydrolase
MMNTKTKTSFILIGTLILGVIIGALFSAMIRQQRVRRIEGMPHHERFIKSMERVLQPDKEQKQLINQVLDKRFDQIAELRDEYQSKIASIFDSIHQDMETVLTEEQKIRLKEQIKNASSRMVKMRLDRLSATLNLDKNQQSKIEKIFLEMEEKMRDRFPPPGGDFRDRPKFRDRFEALEEMHKKIEVVLTPKQREKYKEMRKGMHKGMKPPFDFPFREPGIPPRPDSLIDF